MPNRPNRVRREGPLLTLGIIWSKDSTTVTGWSRWMVRRFLRAKESEMLFELLTPVDAKRAFCLHCLSHNLHLDPDDGQWIYCGDCDTYFLVKEPPPLPPAPPPSEGC